MNSQITASANNPLILANALEITRDDEIEASRNRALLCAPIELVHKMGAAEVSALKEILQHGETFGYWLTPQKWNRTQGGEATLNIDIRKRITNFLPAELQTQLPQDGNSRLSRLVDLAVLVETRYLVLLRMGPAALGKKGRAKSLDPTTVKLIAYSYMPHILAIGVAKALKAEHFLLTEEDSKSQKLLSLLEQSDFESMSNAAKASTFGEVARIHRLSQYGYWDDVPSFGSKVDVITRVRGDAVKKPPERKIDVHLPLPDDYVSEMGVKSLWLINHLGPNLLDLGGQIIEIWENTEDPHLSESAVSGRRKALVNALLENHVWRDASGVAFREPPFKIRLTQHGKRSHHDRNLAKRRAKLADAGDENSDDIKVQDLNWPPRSFGELMSLMGNLQLAHLFVVNMSTAGRKSESIDLTRNCVRYERNEMPYARGRTFKLVERHDGEFRDWVLPDMAALAIEQQVRLVRCMERIGTMTPDRNRALPSEEPQHLWAQYGVGKSDRKKPLIGLGQALTAYAKSLCMDTAPGGQNFRSHRFRKTVARLVALAITQAPKVLMDVFGHKSIEMTLYYILADKDLRAEIEKVSRELRILRATKTIGEMVEEEDAVNGYGGPAAQVLKTAITSHKQRTHQLGEDWGASSVAELAEILTLQGKAWQYVRPGIICTKFPGTESGPCNKSKGHPEPARCQSHCNHRLEEPFLREDVDGAIRDCIREYLIAEANNEELVLEFWAGQIRSHLNRFADIREKWSMDPTVRRLSGILESAA
ncbi:hypothetical protein GTP23_17145 [Pseudoduganella sp. FT93W]|uniref:Uncharacterized protein n=1 Tax=Duganella fentianensis TaxID=2692177 RepID=A0A845I4A6_9BURK|nr:hypothetical protein [Duganella fentianensis]MYN46771.1 hypothetical protein [Duganella fentianensis]